MTQQRSPEKSVGPMLRPASAPPRPTLTTRPTPPPLPRRHPTSTPSINAAAAVVGAAVLSNPALPPYRATADTLDASDFLDDTDVDVDGLTRSEPPPFCAPRWRALAVKVTAVVSAVVVLVITLLFVTGSTQRAGARAAAALSSGDLGKASSAETRVLRPSAARGLSAKVTKHVTPVAHKAQPKAKPRVSPRPSSKAPAQLAASKKKPKAKPQTTKKPRRP